MALDLIHGQIYWANKNIPFKKRKINENLKITHKKPAPKNMDQIKIYKKCKHGNVQP